MLAYKHILLATDLSDETDNVAETAATWAKLSNGKLSIVHVLEHSPVVYGGGEFSIPLDLSVEEQLGENAKKALAILANKFHIDPEDQYICHGSVKREVTQLAERLSIDLIVVGSHGHSGIDFLLGSTANAILHSANCDVLAIRTIETP